jgi:hypothetical protein
MGRFPDGHTLSSSRRPPMHQDRKGLRVRETEVTKGALAEVGIARISVPWLRLRMAIVNRFDSMRANMTPGTSSGLTERTLSAVRRASLTAM